MVRAKTNKKQPNHIFAYILGSYFTRRPILRESHEPTELVQTLTHTVLYDTMNKFSVPQRD